MNNKNITGATESAKNHYAPGSIILASPVDKQDASPTRHSTTIINGEAAQQANNGHRGARLVIDADLVQQLKETAIRAGHATNLSPIEVA